MIAWSLPPEDAAEVHAAIRELHTPPPPLSRWARFVRYLNRPMTAG